MAYPTSEDRDARWDYRHRSGRRTANYTTWDAIHEVYSPGVNEGERAIVSRILRGGGLDDGIPSYATTRAPRHPFGIAA